jgi:hypothetical protein
MRKRKYWYFRHIKECALCGADRSYRERRYGRKPKDHMKRSSFEQFACDGHFM